MIKLVGFLTGAGISGLAVWGIYEWRHVSDEHRFKSALIDHCLPYVDTGEAPFVGMGRSVGVYDAANLAEHIFNGGNAVLFDGRAIAQWGDRRAPDSGVLECQIAFGVGLSGPIVFEIDGQRTLDWLLNTVADDRGLIQFYGASESLPTTVILMHPEHGPTGLSIWVSILENGVTGFRVVKNLNDPAPFVTY